MKRSERWTPEDAMRADDCLRRRMAVYYNYGHTARCGELVMRAAARSRRFFTSADAEAVIRWYQTKYHLHYQQIAYRLDHLVCDFVAGLFPCRRFDRMACAIARLAAQQLDDQYDNPSGPYCLVDRAECWICQRPAVPVIVRHAWGPVRLPHGGYGCDRRWRTQHPRVCRSHRCRMVYGWYVRNHIYTRRNYWKLRKLVNEAQPVVGSLYVLAAYLQAQVEAHKSAQRRAA